jgi:hypothetical protein
MATDFVRIGTVADPQAEANFVELQRVIKALNNKVDTMEKQIKALGGK